MISSPDHAATLTGTFTHGALPASPYMCLRGTFQLFNDDKRTPDTTNLTYEFDMVGTDGSVLHFSGHKLVTPSVSGSPLRTWKATSTLYVTITQTNTNNSSSKTKIVGRGILNIDPSQFGSELATFTPSGTGLLPKVSTTTRFLTFFSKQVARVFFSPFSSLQWPAATASGFISKPSVDEVLTTESVDSVTSLMHYWAPVDNSKAKSIPLLFIPGAAVDHQIFAMPTIERNSIEYFTSAGYHVYCITHRVGKTEMARQGFTTYDARFDIHAALAGIRKHRQSSDKIYVVCHCAGSVAFSSGVLDGTIPASWIAGVTASNVFFNPIFAKVNMLKARLPVSMAKTYYL